MSQGLVIASLALCRCRVPSLANVERWSSYLVREHEQSHALPLWGVLADVTEMLSQHQLGATVLRATDTLVPPSARLAQALLAYEHHFLGRLAREPHLVKLVHTLESQRKDSKLAALLAVATQVLERMDGLVLYTSSEELRHLMDADPQATLSRCYALWRDQPALLEQLAIHYEALVNAAHAQSALLSEADVFLAEHIAVLHQRSQRLAARQLWEISEAFIAAWPARLRIADQTGWVQTATDQDDAYPAGGFSGISTKGTLENLVPSELVYIDDHGPWDLFDVRYTEGDLLYYTRDEAVLSRGKRAVLIALDGDLVEARTKDAGLQWQRLMIVLGLVHAMVRRLVDWLGDEELSITIVLADELQAEEQLLGLTLLEWRDRGLVEVVRSSKPLATWAASHQGSLAHLGMAAAADLQVLPRDWPAWVRSGLGVLGVLCAGDRRLLGQHGKRVANHVQGSVRA